MKLKSNVEILLKSITIFAVIGQAFSQHFSFAFLSKSQWKVGSLRANAGWGKFTLPGLEGLPEREKEDILATYNSKHFFFTDTNGNFINSVGVASVYYSKGLAKADGAVLLRISSNVDLDGREYRLYVQNPVTNNPPQESITTSEDYHTVRLGPYWVVDTEWEDTGFDIFKWIKRVMLVTQFYVIFCRPALNKMHRVPIAWFGSSIMMI
jgi:hypothetical protein